MRSYNEIGEVIMVITKSYNDIGEGVGTIGLD